MLSRVCCTNIVIHAKDRPGFYLFVNEDCSCKPVKETEEGNYSM